MIDCLGDTVPAKGVLAGCRRNRIYKGRLADNAGEVWVNMFNIVISDFVSHCLVMSVRTRAQLETNFTRLWKG